MRPTTIQTWVAMLLVIAVAGCGSNDGGRAATPTVTASASPTASPTEGPVLCSVLNAPADVCPSPAPTLAPCAGQALTTCSADCPVGDGCCLAAMPVPQCFTSGNIGNTLCADDPSQACEVVAPPTPTVTPTPPVTATPTVTETPSTTPTSAPLSVCSGTAYTECNAHCSSGSGCCTATMPVQCFMPGEIDNTLCKSDPSAACLLAATPTVTATATPSATGTATVTPTATDTPEGGIPTPTLAPGTCDAMCGDNGPPDGCMTLPPNGDSISGAPPALIVDACLVVGSGQHVYGYVNVIDGGTLYFADDGGVVDFRANSVLVQQGGLVKAGSWCCPFGSYGGTLDIGLWGTDPTDQGTQPPSTPGIGCVNPSRTPAPCFAHELSRFPHYCTVADSDDPCSSETAPSVGDNALFEGHLDHGGGGLPFDGGAAFGFKVLAVTYGGSLELFGLKGVAAEYRSDPSVAETTCAVPPVDEQHDPDAWASLTGESWARLDETALPQGTSIAIDRSVNWEQGDRLVVTSTDWHAGHNELVTIAGVEGASRFELSAPLSYGHTGEVYDVRPDIPEPPSANQQVDTRAAVGLLSRDIRVYSLGGSWDDPFPSLAECGYQGDAQGNATTPADCYFGGHVIARQGFQTFQVQGVEFAELGQGGRLAHYPVHFHLAKSTAYTNAFLKDSAIHSSTTRFVTVHGTHDVEVARNVGYVSVGHGYYLEDGTEIDNLLCHNLAASVQGSLVEYFKAQDPESPTFRFSPPILPSVQIGPPYGADSYMPVAFWTMNTWNELVGNKAVGVGGFGSCFWLLGAGVSGPSLDLSWSTSTTTPDGYANYNRAAMRQAPVKRFRGNACSTSQYALQTTLKVDPPPPPPPTPVVSGIASQYGYTAVTNPYAMTTDMLPDVDGDFLPVLIGGDGCATQRTQSGTGGNAASCALTLLDRFATSFNWAPVDFGAVWLRPQFFAFVNGAVTDQLFGGLTFVSGGAWTQAPPGYFTITRDSLYAGSTHPDLPGAGRFGPSLDLAGCVQDACPLPADGTALFLGGFQPKRLINIYDGPFFAEGNAFTNAPALACDPTTVTDGDPECGIYMSTVQPKTCDGLPSILAPDSDGGMCVLNAAVGWKQPNGFYYPPAFAFENTAFDAETIRHNVVDVYNTYVQGTVTNPSQPGSFDPLQTTYTGITPIDSSTILNDFDGTFTGNCWGADCEAMPAASAQRRTSSVSANRFFDAPSQTPECLSYGVQTSPSEFLTSVVAPLTADGTAIDQSAWGTFPAVPIYRQLLLTDESPCSGSICDGTSWSCDSAAFMMGAENGQAPYLTADGGVYYIDTASAQQSTACVANANYSTAAFSAGSSYVLYQLFAKDDATTTYQLYTGADAPAGQWVWVQPHVASDNNMVVDAITDATLLAQLNQQVSQPTPGIVEVVFDNSLIADQFAFTARAADEQCVPRDACQVAADGSQCELATGFAETDLAGAVGAICEKWATRVAGTTATSGNLSLSDCPGSGCLGYSFQLPAGWTPQPYATVGAPLATCFPDDDTWNRPLQVTTADAMICATPPAPAGFCPAPTPTPTPPMD